MIGHRYSHFRVLERIGAGGMGEVYVADDELLGRRVALKFLSAELAKDQRALQRFHHEARAVAELSDPNIATLYDFEAHPEHPYLVLEYVEGQTLRDRLDEGPMDADQVERIAESVARGLAAAHARGIIHCDIKPANVMLTRGARVKILDFGLARARCQIEEAKTDALARTLPTLWPVGGTPAYLAPELLQGEDPTPATDVWSWGVVVYEMLTGSPPFEGNTNAEIVSSVLRDGLAPIATRAAAAPRVLADLAERCLSRDPGRRPPDARALLELLGEAAPTRMRRASWSSVAVLPFVDMSPQRDQEFFGEGIAEELTYALSTLPGLRVASRTSAFRFRHSELGSREIGRALGVDLLVQGSVRRVGELLRITTQLVDVDSDQQVWAERYDHDVRDVLKIQDDIAHSIATALQRTLHGDEIARRMPPTRDAEAYELFLRGRKLFAEFRRRSVETALGLFRLALRRDPDYALAHAGVADCCCYLFLYADRREGSLRDALDASARAVQLCPELGEVQASRGQVLSMAGRHDEARICFERALELGPELFEAHYLHARDSFAQGRLEEAAREFERAAEVCPSDYQSPLLVAQVYDSLGRSGPAKEARKRGVQVASERLRNEPGDVRALYMGANGLAALGRHEQALEWVRLARCMEPDDPMVLYNVACVLSLLDRRDEAMEVLERAVMAGLVQKGWILHDSNLDRLRGMARYAELLARFDGLEKREEDA